MAPELHRPHFFTFVPKDSGTLAHSEESWEGIIPSVLKSYSRKTLDKTIKGVLSRLKAEPERRTATA
jgi:hypothetical protein